MSDLLSIYKELQAKKWVDLSHQINAESPHFPALPALQQEDLFTLKDGFHVQKFTVVGQYGTHIDAPIHFVEGGRWLDEIDLKDLLLPLYVIDKSKEVAANPNFILSKQDILDFEAEHGQIVEGAFVAFRSDWSKRWPDQDAMRNLDENGVQQSPGWSREALEFLIHERHVKAVGHETFDTDAGIPAAEHGLVNEYYLLEQNIYQVEAFEPIGPSSSCRCFDFDCFPSLGQGNWFTCPCHCHLTINKEKSLKTDVAFGRLSFLYFRN